MGCGMWVGRIIGVIIGWDSICSAEEDWIVSMGVDTLARGRTQPFYEVLVDADHWGSSGGGAGTSYVAQQNVLWTDPATTTIRNRRIPEVFEDDDDREVDDGDESDEGAAGSTAESSGGGGRILVGQRRLLAHVRAQYPDDFVDSDGEVPAAASGGGEGEGEGEGEDLGCGYAEWGGFEGLRKRGLEAAERCLEIDPKHGTALCMRGALQLLADAPQAEDAIQSLEASLRANPWGGGLSPAAPLLYRARRFARESVEDDDVRTE